MDQLFTASIDDYDLDGLIRMGYDIGSDFIFVIQEEDQPSYYIDRMELQKYDNNVQQLAKRIVNYLACDETHGIFILYARQQGDGIELFDEYGIILNSVGTGDVVLSESTFYGMLIMQQEEEYFFFESIYECKGEEGNAQISLVQNSGYLGEHLEEYMKTFC